MSVLATISCRSPLLTKVRQTRAPVRYKETLWLGIPKQSETRASIHRSQTRMRNSSLPPAQPPTNPTFRRAPASNCYSPRPLIPPPPLTRHQSHSCPTRCDGKACIANWKLEQETTEGTRIIYASLPMQAGDAAPAPKNEPPNQGAIRASNQDMYHLALCAIKAPGPDEPTRHPPRAQQVPSQRTHNQM